MFWSVFLWSVCLCVPSCLNHLTHDLDFWPGSWAHLVWIWRSIKVIGQGEGDKLLFVVTLCMYVVKGQVQRSTVRFQTLVCKEMQLTSATTRCPNKQPRTLSIQPRTSLVYEGKSRSHDQTWPLNDYFLRHFVVYWTGSVLSWAAQPRTILTLWLNIPSISFNVRGCLFGQRALAYV